ncbi:serine hydrolase domain-containing protein [Clostridium sp.]|uniref:serine hydrolase domain-containing protein n=1 Tax=Clostridium sp. TaxID=1506 RepID=UPI003F4B6434
MKKIMDAHVIKSQILNKNLDFSGVILLSINGETIVQEVMGESNISEHMPNHINTRFAIASGCKIFTAIAILKLVEMGKLSLDQSVKDCLPNYFPSMNNSVTIRHLLTHTSGFCDYFDEEIDEDGYAKVWESIPMYMMKSPDDFLRLLQDKEMEFEPGYRFKYNNGGFVILSMIIEKISGMDFSMFIHKYIFDICGMSHSGYFSMDSLPGDTAIGYTDNGKGGLKTNIYSVPIIGGGDGGAYTTASDMYLFWDSLLNGKLLSVQSIQAMFSPQIKTGENGVSYGYGVWLDTLNDSVMKIHIMGGDPGVSFRSAYYPNSKIVCTVLCNRDEGSRMAFKVAEDMMSTM